MSDTTQQQTQTDQSTKVEDAALPLGSGQNACVDQPGQQVQAPSSEQLDDQKDQQPNVEQSANKGEGSQQDGAQQSLEMLKDVDLNVRIELGRTRMLVEEVLKLKEGCVVEMDKLAGEPVDIYVNEQLVARGEVLVLNENFCVRISQIVTDTG